MACGSGGRALRVAALEQVTKDHDEQRAGNAHAVFGRRRIEDRPTVAGRVIDDQAARDPAEQRRAERDDDRKAVEQFQHQLAAPHDQRNTHQQPENHQRETMLGIGRLGRAGNRDHVVEAHHRIRDDDGLDRRDELVGRLHVLMGVMRGRHQTYADPQQQQPARELQQRHVEQYHGKRDQRDAQHNRAGRAPQHALGPLRGREIAASERDHHGVIATQQDVDDDDLDDCAPMEGGEELEHERKNKKESDTQPTKKRGS
ncbi:hypothetical protein KCU90_g381, partial [Aureobasidium melanogenum]